MEIIKENVVIHLEDCINVLRSMPDNSVDSVVTDPPYGLSFMGKKWDYDVPSVDIWRECLRVLKPGGHLLAFAGTRTQHRMACRIEDAGFEIRDMIAWVYGSGFPKGKNFPNGTGTQLKPAMEPITLARKPIVGTVESNVGMYKTGVLNIDNCRVKSGAMPSTKTFGNEPSTKNNMGQYKKRVEPWEKNAAGRWPANLTHDGSPEVLALFPESKSGGGREGEPGKRNYARSNTVFGAQTCGLNGSPDGKLFTPTYNDTGSAARFFFCAKACPSDRGEGNTHPTVKPTKLMRYLCRLVTPPGGVILDPFCGSGSTGKAAIRDGFGFVGVERDHESYATARERLLRETAQGLLDLDNSQVQP